MYIRTGSTLYRNTETRSPRPTFKVSPLSVTVFQPRFNPTPSGGQRVALTYANELAHRGHDVTVLSGFYYPTNEGKPDSRLKELAANQYVRFHPRFRRPSWFDLHPDVNVVSRYCIRERHVPDADAAIACYGGKTSPFVVSLPPSKGVGFHLIQGGRIYHPDSDRDATRLWNYPLQRIVVSEWLYDRGLEMGVPEKRLCHVPNAVNHDTFRVTEPVEGRDPVVAMAYETQAYKRFEDGWNAVRAARQDHPELEAVVFGGEDPKISFPEWCTYRPTPSDEELAALYNRAAVFVHPSEWEGWGLPPMEAMACGCAVVGTDHGGIREFATDDETAILCPVGDVDCLTDGIDGLLENALYRREMAEAAVEHVGEFTWSRSCDQLLQCLRTAIDRQ